jgi:hypothetical protein
LIGNQFVMRALANDISAVQDAVVRRGVNVNVVHTVRE